MRGAISLRSALRAAPRRWLSSEATVAAPEANGSVTIEVQEPSVEFNSALKPRETVERLDDYIVGQADAKRAVAIAMRNRWRRHQLPEDLRGEVIPKNILMIGPTGCGKTEIARRIAKLSQAPFLKVEATKFTEVGFHGRDVDQIIRDLVEVSLTLTKKKQADLLQAEVEKIAEDRILEILTGPHPQDTRESFRQLLRDGALDERNIEIEVRPSNNGNDKGGIIQVDSPVSMQEVLGKFQKMVNRRPSEMKKMKIRDARPLIVEQELEKLMEQIDLKKEAITAVEESGIVFIDEIDKICSSGHYRGADASAEGVQRDLLPLIEGSVISTKYGNVSTDYILFVASGAFHTCKPSDLLAELQGRLPIRVELKGLTEADMYRILTEPVSNLIKQQTALMATEEVDLVFTDEAIREISKMAAEVNRTLENIGARRLHTIIERIMEDISFEAADRKGEQIVVDVDRVRERVGPLLVKSDLSKFIL